MIKFQAQLDFYHVSIHAKITDASRTANQKKFKLTHPSVINGTASLAIVALLSRSFSRNFIPLFSMIVFISSIGLSSSFVRVMNLENRLQPETIAVTGFPVSLITLTAAWIVESSSRIVLKSVRSSTISNVLIAARPQDRSGDLDRRFKKNVSVSKISLRLHHLPSLGHFNVTCCCTHCK